MSHLKVKDVLAALKKADPEADFCMFSDFGTVALQHIAVYNGEYHRPLGNKLVLEHVNGHFVGVGNPGNFDGIEVPELVDDLTRP